MGIFGNDEGHEEIDLDEEIAAAERAEDPAPAPVEPDGQVKVRVVHAHNGLRRGDEIVVSAERAEAMLKSGVVEEA